MIRQLHRTTLVLGCILVFSISIGLAQPTSFFFVNDGNVDVDRNAVENVAQNLIDDFGARVGIYVVVSGNSRDFTSRLNEDRLSSSFAGTRDNTLAIYIATEEQYSEIRWGSDFDRMDGSRIRSEALNPALRDREFTQALVNTLQSVHDEMTNPLVSIRHLLGQLLSNPVVLLIIGFLLFLYIGNKMGFEFGDGSSNGYSDHSSSSSSSGSSWSSGSSSGGGSSGGSSGGSWND